MLTGRLRKVAVMAASVAMFGGVLFGFNAALGSETSGTVYQCKNGYTGAARFTSDPNLCTRYETPYEIEGEIWVPTPTPVPGP